MDIAVADRFEGRGRTLLMFAYYFPPCTCWPTASERSLGFATGLSELGWRPVIVTREVVDAGCACGPFPTPPEELYRGFPEENVRALSLWHREPPARLHHRSRLRYQLRWLRQDLEILLDVKNDDWVARAIDAGEAILSEREVAAIWTTTGPHSSVRIGEHFKRRFGLPWIADMRDGFMRRSFRPGRRVTLRRRFRVRRTLSTVRGLDLANARIYVEDGEASSDEGLFRSEAHVIPSGFDARSWGQLRLEARHPIRGRDDPLIVLYAGYVYDEREGHDIFFRGLRLFAEQAASHRNVRVEHMGPNPEAFLASAERGGVRESVVSKGRVSLEESRRAMTRADVLLLITASGARGVPGSKVYEYAAAGPPVLAVPGGDDFSASLLHLKGLGTAARTPSDVAAFLQAATQKNAIREPWEARLQRLDGYSWEARSRSLSGLLSSVLRDPQATCV
jgi:glycosyltransferase involved in cell wall biosynthesis